MKPPLPPPHTCSGCIHLSARDACCELRGVTRHGRDEACREWSDGRVMMEGEVEKGGVE